MLAADNWSAKAIRRKTTGTGRMRHLRDMPRRAKNHFREGKSDCSVFSFVWSSEYQNVLTAFLSVLVLQVRLQGPGHRMLQHRTQFETMCFCKVFKVSVPALAALKLHMHAKGLCCCAHLYPSHSRSVVNSLPAAAVLLQQAVMITRVSRLSSQSWSVAIAQQQGVGITYAT